MKTKQYLEILEKRKRCVIEELLETINGMRNDETINKDQIQENFYFIVDKSLEMDVYIGSSADFHNIGVECARKKALDIACDFLEKGINYYPRSMDLLADYLQYGPNCQRHEKCERCCRVLRNIPKDQWTGRAFYFMVSYLLNSIERVENIDISQIKEETTCLVKEFQNYYPTDENGYLAELMVYEIFGEKRIQEKQMILQNALEKVKRAPKISLRLADMYYENMQLQDALIILKRCRHDSIEHQMSVNQGYLYYLEALCQLSLFPIT